MIIPEQAAKKSKSRNVTGNVVDGKGDPLIGVTVLEKGTANGTANGTNGSKALVSPKTGDQASIILWVLAAMFAAGIGVTVILRKRSAQ